MKRRLFLEQCALTLLGDSVTVPNSDYVLPYMQHWQVSVQRELAWEMLFEAAYVGTHAVKLVLESVNLNEVPDATNLYFNLVGNYIKGGPDTPASGYGYALASGASIYDTDNVYPGYGVFSAFRPLIDLAERVPAPPITYHTSGQAFDAVLAKAGTFPRDPMNERVVQEVLSGTGTLGKQDDPHLSTSWAVPADADLDGMPDDWETDRGLDPADPADAALDRNGDGFQDVATAAPGATIAGPPSRSGSTCSSAACGSRSATPRAGVRPGRDSRRDRQGAHPRHVGPGAPDDARVHGPRGVPAPAGTRHGSDDAQEGTIQRPRQREAAVNRRNSEEFP